ncbi:hypothetical protein PITC_030140 [Penicillium italicum]|uniref:Myb-like DNA-binding domain-containing protein n=1 Tax=Penicillium italicum TaxID=40296 RepID=A0A0A2L6G6_PENIT|nr:hypothetical protein PITC_030140 [Penicillium italicum]
MAPPSVKGKEPAKAVSLSKVKKTRVPKATPKMKFTENEAFLYLAIKNGGAKFDYEAIGKAIGKSKDATRMKMSRLLKSIGNFLEDQEELTQSAQPEREQTSANIEDAENGSQDDKDESEDDETPVKTSDMADV